MHSLATDQTVPANLRNLFAQVTCQIVRHWDDGSESLINFRSRHLAEAKLPEYAARIGATFADGAVLANVTIRDL